MAEQRIYPYLYVDDVDARCRRAWSAGATIESEPEDKGWGDRMYTARDPEGNQWYFATQVRR
jgi:PhnB protein